MKNKISLTGAVLIYGRVKQQLLPREKQEVI